MREQVVTGPCDSQPEAVARPLLRSRSMNGTRRRGIAPILTLARTAVLVLSIVVVVPATGRAQGTVVKDHLCGLYDAEGGMQLGAFGVSTMAPNGMMHLVCTATVPAPGVPVVFGPSETEECWIENRFATEWVERISPSGQAVLDCWVNPRIGRP
jgi:hypothetical protein